MRTTIIPCLRYRNAPAMIDWLCQAFGFERHRVVPGDGDAIAHAQLKLGDAMVMLGSNAHRGDYGRYTAQPGELGGRVTQAAYVVIAEIDAHCARAKEAGAVMLVDIADQDYGGRVYTCRDPEGHVWSFGSYDPWADPAQR